MNPFFSSRSDSRTGDSSFSLLYYVYRSSVTDGVTSRRIFGIPF